MSRSMDEALEVLGVAADSDLETVAHAYRRLARTIHPDVSAEPDAAQRFATIAAAYRLVADRARSEHPAGSDHSAGPGAGRQPADAPAHAVVHEPWLASSIARRVRSPVGRLTTADDFAPGRALLGAPPFTPARPWHGATIVAGPVMVHAPRPDPAADKRGTGDV